MTTTQTRPTPDAALVAGLGAHLEPRARRARIEELTLTHLSQWRIAEYERTTSQPCRDDPSVCPGYCRCSRIHAARVTRIDLDEIVLVLAPAIATLRGEDELDPRHQHALERTLTAGRVFEPERWELSWPRGYYGDEIDHATLLGDGQITQDLLVLATVSPDEAVAAALRFEYGHLLPHLVGARYEIVEVELSEVGFGRSEYASSRPGAYPRALTERILGILREVPGELRLVDGYHRTTAALAAGSPRGRYLLARTG